MSVAVVEKPLNLIGSTRQAGFGGSQTNSPVAEEKSTLVPINLRGVNGDLRVTESMLEEAKPVDHLDESSLERIFAAMQVAPLVAL